MKCDYLLKKTVHFRSTVAYGLQANRNGPKSNFTGSLSRELHALLREAASGHLRVPCVSMGNINCVDFKKGKRD